MEPTSIYDYLYNLIIKAKANNLQIKNVGGIEGSSETEHYKPGTVPSLN